MTDRIFTDANGRKYINNEPRLHPPQRTPLTSEERSSIVNVALRGHASTRDAIDWAIRYVERHHGIKEQP